MTTTDAGTAVAPARSPIAVSRGSRFVQRWRRPFLGALVLWAVVRLVLVGLAVLVHRSVATSSLFFADNDWFFRLFHHWDSYFFTAIAHGGYFSAEASSVWQAFFPGYSMVIRAIATPVFGLHPTLAQLIAVSWFVTLVASLIAATILWRIVADRYDNRIALAATALFMAGPYSHFLVASYSEALFLAFGLAAWLSASRVRWVSAGLLAALASASRANGLFLIVGLMVLFALFQRREGKPFVWRTLVMGAIGASGVLAYFVYLFVKTGDLLAWSHAQQAGWDRVTQWPWTTLYVTLREAVAVNSPFSIQYVFDILFAIGLLFAIVIMVRRKWWPEVVYLGLTAVSLMTSLNYVSLARNTVTLFPIVILLASTLLSKRWKWVYWVALVLGVLLMLYNASMFTLGLWSD
ncbi:MAG: hypothetical protein JWO10_102 [Microbacteriaceae bacterium]|nr:hypothetical protein [Microbacteriaceae bacterium]